MEAPVKFGLYHFIHENAPNSTAVLAGSATPGLTLDDLRALSSDPPTTSHVFDSLFTKTSMVLASDRGSDLLRQNIASTYNTSTSSTTSQITAEDIIAVNGTTGANHIVHRSLLTKGDHVVVQYPTYGPLIEEPQDIGCDISYLRLDPAKQWAFDVEQLNQLIRPGKTKMIVLNNPSNPTGTHLDDETQRSIIRLAKQHGIIVHCDEIFRPFFHTTGTNKIPGSLIDHPDLGYDQIITTSSLSKAYGLSGVRVGWITTRSPLLRAKFSDYRMFSVQALSQFDEVIAAEVLGPRCRQGILQKHLALAERNLGLIQRFVDAHSKQCEWVRPTAGSVAFVKFLDYTSGEPVDDVLFCRRLVERKGVLLSPATLCFELPEVVGHTGGGKGLDEFKGRTRFHFTCPTEVVEMGLKGLGEFLDEERTVTNGVNGLKLSA